MLAMETACFERSEIRIHAVTTKAGHFVESPSHRWRRLVSLVGIDFLLCGGVEQTLSLSLFLLLLFFFSLTAVSFKRRFVDKDKISLSRCSHSIGLSVSVSPPPPLRVSVSLDRDKISLPPPPPPRPPLCLSLSFSPSLPSSPPFPSLSVKFVFYTLLKKRSPVADLSSWMRLGAIAGTVSSEKSKTSLSGSVQENVLEKNKNKKQQQKNRKTRAVFR